MALGLPQYCYIITLPTGWSYKHVVRCRTSWNSTLLWIAKTVLFFPATIHNEACRFGSVQERTPIKVQWKLSFEMIRCPIANWCIVCLLFRTIGIFFFPIAWSNPEPQRKYFFTRFVRQLLHLSSRFEIHVNSNLLSMNASGGSMVSVSPTCKTRQPLLPPRTCTVIILSFDIQDYQWKIASHRPPIMIRSTTKSHCTILYLVFT